jgi:hypothetical protein
MYLPGAKTFTTIVMPQGNIIMISSVIILGAKGRREDAILPLLPILGVLVDDLGVIVVNSGLSTSASRSVILCANIL